LLAATPAAVSVQYDSNFDFQKLLLNINICIHLHT
jgi:hypothetical protein